MLKNKKALFVLIPLTLLIWGLIGYKIYTGLTNNDEVVIDDNGFIPTATVRKTSDTFSLFNNYADPFLRSIHLLKTNASISSKSSNQISTKNNIPVKTSTANTSNDWPNVQFSGTIKNQTNAVTLLLITVNNKTYTVKQGESVEGLKVLSFSGSEVVLQRGNEKRSFTK